MRLLSTLLLTSRIVESRRARSVCEGVLDADRQVDPLDTLFGRTASDDIADLVRYRAGAGGAHRVPIGVGATQLAFELERLDRQGYFVLTPFDDDYPRRLVERSGGPGAAIHHGGRFGRDAEHRGDRSGRIEERHR